MVYDVLLQRGARPYLASSISELFGTLADDFRVPHVAIGDIQVQAELTVLEAARLEVLLFRERLVRIFLVVSGEREIAERMAQRVVDVLPVRAEHGLPSVGIIDGLRHDMLNLVLAGIDGFLRVIRILQTFQQILLAFLESVVNVACCERLGELAVIGEVTGGVVLGRKQ